MLVNSLNKKYSNFLIKMSILLGLIIKINYCLFNRFYLCISVYSKIKIYLINKTIFKFIVKYKPKKSKNQNVLEEEAWKKKLCKIIIIQLL